MKPKFIPILLLFILFSSLTLAMPEPTSIDASRWERTKFDGIQEEYFDLTEERLDNGMLKLCLWPKVDTTSKDYWYEDNTVIFQKNGELKGQLGPDDFETEKEQGKIKKMCVDLDQTLADEYKIGSATIIYKWINETWLKYEDVNPYHKQGFYAEAWVDGSKVPEDCIAWYEIEGTYKHWFDFENCSESYTYPLENPEFRIYNHDKKLEFVNGTIKSKNQCVENKRNLDTGEIECAREEWYEYSFQDMIDHEENSVTNITIEEVPVGVWDYMKCFAANILDWDEMRECMNRPAYFHATIEGYINNTDPELELTFVSGLDLLEWQDERSDINNHGASSLAPVFFMDFNSEDSGNYVQDNSIYNNQGTKTGATYNSSCTGANYRMGGCYEFDGNADYINMGDVLDPLENDFTISAWVNPDDYDDWGHILQKGSGANGFSVMIEQTTGNIRIRIDGTAADLGTDVVPTDAWSHVVVVFDRDGNATGYINATEVGSVDISGEAASIDVANNLQIGALSTNEFDGQIDNVYYWHRTLDQEEIQELFDGSVSGFNNTDYAGKYHKEGSFKTLVYYNETPTYWTLSADFSSDDYKDYLIRLQEEEEGTEGLVHYWRFDGDVQDSFGTNHGTNVGSTNAVGAVHTARRFDGTSNRVEGDTINTISKNEPFTLAMWFKADDISGTQTIFRNIIGSSNRFVMNMDGPTLRTGIYNGGSYFVKASEELEANKWYHAVIRYNGSSEYSLWLNGANVTSTENPAASASTGLTIGSDGSLWYFDGLIDEVVVFNRTLSDSEATDLYMIQSDYYKIDLDDEDLLLYLPLSGAPEEATENGYTISGHGLNLSTGLSSEAILTDGSTGYVDIDEAATDINNNENGTISIWFQTESTGSNDRIFSASDKSDASSDLGIGKNSDDKIYFIVREAAVSSLEFETDSAGYADGEWHHLLITVDDDGNTIYIDGQNPDITYSTGSSSTSAWLDDVNNIDVLRVGNNEDDVGNELFWEGSLDEFTLWNRSFSSGEAQQVYETGLTQHATAGVKISSRTATNYNLTDSGIVAHWGFNADDATYAFDSLGDNNATRQGSIADATEANGLAGKGYSFDGSNDYLDADVVMDDLLTADDFTVAMWVKVDADTNDRVMPFYMHNAGSTDFLFGLDLAGSGDTTDSFDTWIRQDGSMRWRINAGANFYDDYIGKWAHWALTHDGTAPILYVDGKEVDINFQTSTEITAGWQEILVEASSDANQLDLGAQQSNGLHHADYVDEIRIYNRSLSATEIVDLYEMGDTFIAWNARRDGGSIEDQTEVSADRVGFGNFLQVDFITETDETQVTPNIFSYSIGTTEESSPIFDYVTLNTTNINRNASRDNLTAYAFAQDNGGLAQNQTINYRHNWYKGSDLNGTTLITDGLAHYYPLDFNSKDYHGTEDFGMSGKLDAKAYGGAVRAPGVFGGNGYYFDGDGDFLQTNDRISTNSSLTYTAWFKADGWGENGIGRIVGHNGLSIYVQSTGATLAAYNDQAASGVIGGNGSVVSLGTWYHVGYTTYQNGTACIYQDGEKLDCDDIGATQTDDGYVYIGALTPTLRYFNGTIDELGLWDRILSQAEIQEVMNATRPQTFENITAYYPFTEDPKDYSMVQDGKVKDGYYFDGTGSYYIKSSETNYTNTTVTVCAWVKNDDSTGSFRGYIHTDVEWLSGSENDGWVLEYIGVQGAGKYRFNTYNDGALVSSFTDTTSDWMFICGANNGTHSTVYKNAVAQETNAGTIKPNTGTRDVYISSPSFPFNGTIDEVQVYDRALDLSEIQLLYQGGRFGGTVMNASETEEGQTWKHGSVACDPVLCSVEQNSSEQEIRYRPVLTEVILNATTADNTTDDDLTGYVTATDGDGDSLTHFYNWYKNGELNATRVLTESLVSYWPLDNDTLDYQGKDDGTATGATLNTTGGKVSGAYYFDGTNDRIVTSPITTDWTSGSIAIWTNWDDTSGTQMLFSEGDSGDYFEMYATGSPGDDIYFRYGDGSNFVSSLNSITAGEWHHYVFWWDNTIGARIYKDGELEASKSTTWSAPVLSEELYFGTRPALNYDWAGYMDEIQYYNDPLNTTEILMLYEGTRAGHLKLDSASTSEGENWTLEVTAYDPYDFSEDTLNSSNITITEAAVPSENISPYWDLNKTNLTQYTDNGEEVYFNITLYDANTSTGKYVFEYYNGSTWSNSTNTSWTNATEIQVLKNITIDNGTISWRWHFWDDVNNYNVTDLWNVTLLPDLEITINFPVQGAIYSGTALDLNVTANIPVSDWNYSLNGIPQGNFTPNTTIFIYSTGHYNLTVFAENGGGVANASVSFTFVSFSAVQGRIQVNTGMSLAPIALILGIAVICAVLLWIAFKLDNEHFFWKVFILLTVMVVLILVPKAAIDSNENCAQMPVNSTVSGSTTTYSYDLVCTPSTTGTASSLFSTYLWIIRILFIYVTLFIFYKATNNFKDLPKMIERKFNKRR